MPRQFCATMVVHPARTVPEKHMHKCLLCERDMFWCDHDCELEADEDVVYFVACSACEKRIQQDDGERRR